MKRIPFLNRQELKSIYDRAVRSGPCLLIHPDKPTSNPNVVFLRGQPYTLTRVVWAETFGETMAFNTSEVVHRVECPHTTRSSDAAGYGPVCIEPSHLMLGDPFVRDQISTERGTKSHPKCAHGDTNRNATGACRICNRAAHKRYRDKQGASA